MPFALVFVGILLIVVGFQDTYKQFGTQVQNDFSGQGNFIYWLISIGVIGALGYVKEFQTFSRVFIGLLILSMLLSKKGGIAQGITFFNSFNSAVQSGSTSQVNDPGTGLQGSTGSSSGSSSSSGTIGDVSMAAGAISSFV